MNREPKNPSVNHTEITGEILEKKSNTEWNHDGMATITDFKIRYVPDYVAPISRRGLLNAAHTADITVWTTGITAECFAEYKKVGDKVKIEGRLEIINGELVIIAEHIRDNWTENTLGWAD